jgi:hypothetical protein
MPEVKTTDGFFFLAPVLMLISLLIMADNLSGFTTGLSEFLFSIRINLIAAVVFAFGVGFLAIAFAARFKLETNSGVFMFFEGTGLLTAILGFFVYGAAMREQISLPYYVLTVSTPQFFVGLLVWAIGIFLITFAGVCTNRKEEKIIFFIVLVALSISTIALSVLFPLEVVAV